MNAWQVLNLPICLVLEPEEVDRQFREASEGVHPDAGGEKGRFEELREARDLLRDDFRRLEAWLKVKGVEVEHSGEVSSKVGEMFMRVDEVNRGVDAWLLEGSGKSTGLGKALWQKEGFAWKIRVEELLQEVADWQDRVVAGFADIQQSVNIDKALKLRSEMGFLRKWKAGLQGRFGRLWEGLV